MRPLQTQSEPAACRDADAFQRNILSVYSNI